MIVRRMILHLKLDKTDKLWVLWCSSIRIRGEDKLAKGMITKHTPLDLQSNVELPKSIRSTMSPNSKRPAKLRKTMYCLNCAKSHSNIY